MHEEELKRERAKNEHLEKRLKLIVEENNILKSLLLDQKGVGSSNSLQQQQQNLKGKPIQQSSSTSSELATNFSLKEPTLNHIVPQLPTIGQQTQLG